MLGWLKSLTKKPKSRPHVKKKRVRKKRTSDKKVRTASHTAKNKAVILSRGEHGISRNHIDSNALKV